MMASSTSNAPPDSTTEDSTTHATHHAKETTSIDDHALPKSVIVRLAKSVLPENTMIQKEAVTALVKSATVFVNYLAATANDITQQKGKKTINNEEVLSALDIIEFDGIMGPQLRKHIEQFEITRNEKRKRATADGDDRRKKRKTEGELPDEITIETNGDDAETESEKASEDDAESGDEERESEGAEEEEEEEEGEGEEEREEDSLAFDMGEPDDKETDEENTDEALAEDSD